MDLAANQFQQLLLAQAGAARCLRLDTDKHIALSRVNDHLADCDVLSQAACLMFDQHLPMAQAAQALTTQSRPISPETLCRWMGILSEALLPLAARLEARLLQCSVLHANEQTTHVLDGNGDKVRAYVWTHAPCAGQGLLAVLYKLFLGRSTQQTKQVWGHSPSRNKPQRPPDYVQPKLAFVMVNDHLPYKPLFEASAGQAFVTPLACWAQARGQFEALLRSGPCAMAQQALAYIDDLYDTERYVKDHHLAEHAVREARLARSVPALESLHTLLVRHDVNVRYTMDTRLLAIKYCLNRWDALQRYAYSANLPIDNTPLAVLGGPWAQPNKQCLLAGSGPCAQRAVAMMSLLASAKLNGLDPHTYLSHVIAHIPPVGTLNSAELDALLPTPWRPAPPHLAHTKA